MNRSTFAQRAVAHRTFATTIGVPCLLLLGLAGIASAQGFTATYTVGATQITLPNFGSVPPMSFSNSLTSGVVQTVTLMPASAPIGVVVSINNPGAAPWLNVTPSGSLSIPTGGLPLSVSVNALNLSPGTYSGSFQIQSAALVSPTVTVFVTLNIGGTGGGGGGGFGAPLTIVSSSPLPGATFGLPYQYTFQVTGGSGAAYTWAVVSGSLPPNFSFDSSGNLYSPYVTTLSPLPSGLPYTFTVQVRDGAGDVVSQQFTLSLFSPGPPRISTVTLPNATVGAAYGAIVNAVGGQPPYAWSLTGSLPNGLGLTASTGPSVIVSGTPSGLGVTTFTMHVTDSNGASSSQTLTLTVVDSTSTLFTLGPNLAIAGGGSFTLTVGGLGFLYGSAVQWNGVSLPTTYMSATQVTAAISSNLIFNVGTVAITVVNPGGAVSNTLTFAITPGAFSITAPSPLATATAGVAYSQSLLAIGGVSPYTSWTILTGSLPPGITLTTVGGFQAGLLSGVPTVPGLYNFTVQVTDNLTSSTHKQFSLTVGTGPVTISANGIASGASYDTTGIAPGEIVAIFGTNLGPSVLAPLQLGVNGYVTLALAGTLVTFDGVPAPVIYSSADQVGVVVPYEVAGRTSTQVQVTFEGLTSNVVNMPVVLTRPGIFTMDSSGRGQGAIDNQNGTPNSPGNPASAGSIVSVFATGEGQTNPLGIDGKPGATPAPVPLAQPITATIGGTSAQVQYAGGVSGLVAGVMQVNVIVPPGVYGSAVPITIQVGGQTSQTGVTLAIR